MDRTFLDRLAQLAQLEEDTLPWSALVEQLTADAERIVRIAASHSKSFPHLDWRNDADDLLQIVRGVHLDMLRQVTHGTFRLNLEAWEAVLLTRARSAVRAYAATSSATGLSGYSGSARRSRALHALRERLEVEAGTLVGDKTVVDEFNDRRASGSDGRHHAGHATVADLAGVHLAGGDALDDIVVEQPFESTVDDQLAADQLITQVIELASTRGRSTVAVATAWLARWTSDGELPSAVEVAERTGISVATVRSHLQVTRALVRGCRVVAGRSDPGSTAVAQAVADAWLEDVRLGRIAELAYERWGEGQLVPATEIARRLQRDEAEVARALAEIEAFVERHLEVDDQP